MHRTGYFILFFLNFSVHRHTVITFLSPHAPFFFTPFSPLKIYSRRARPKQTDNFCSFFPRPPNQTLKQMTSWCNELERKARNNKAPGSAARAITRSLHPGKQFKYLPSSVKQSGIILYCYNTEKRLSYFPYFPLIPWGRENKERDQIKISLYINYPLTRCLPVGRGN